jgi:hypothetical protein
LTPLSTISDQSEVNPLGLPVAVCFLGFDEYGNVVTVSRRSDPSRLGLLGGKLDPGEDLVTAVLRETEEETRRPNGDQGLTFQPEDLEEIYAGVCKGQQDYWCVTFKCKKTISTIATYRNNEGCFVSCVAPRDLIENSAFATYNRAVFKTCGIEV